MTFTIFGDDMDDLFETKSIKDVVKWIAKNSHIKTYNFYTIRSDDFDIICQYDCDDHVDPWQIMFYIDGIEHVENAKKG